jgi:crotonobetainyl-CoA:carnitine CoA-transferase CaiB-like acyl-CoA transferase
MLDGTRVLDRTGEIAGPYCTKLLADAGADVVRVEPAGGDPLRRWRSGALFDFLNASKRSVTEVGELLAGADLLVTDRPADVDPLWDANPRLVVVTITPFGADGPWSGRPATEFTLQASAGSTGHRGLPESEPLAAGGRLGEWVTGTYAAVGALAALRSARATGRGEVVDVAMLDCMAITMATFPSVFASFLGWPEIRGTGRGVEVPSIEPTADGYAVFTTNSAQQFQDFCLLIGRPDMMDDADLASAVGRTTRRDEFLAAVHEHTTKRTTAELLADAALFRIPSGPVLDGSTIPTFDHFVERGVFGPDPSGRFLQPRVPYRVSGLPARPFEPAPAEREHTGQVDWDPRAAAPVPAAGEPRLPLEGIRVVDCTAWWAGPAATQALALLGADVVKVESVTRPDLMRYTAARPPSEDGWWEWGPMFHATNAGKRGITLDLGRPEGVEVFERLVATADLLVENYTPRVMDQFGLGWDRLHEVNPELIMVRMPAFGLDGPWRDNTGFAQTMESISGMAWLTGFADGPPVLVRGACDPLAGMHAVIAALLALGHRDRHGGGRLVESVMVEAALNAAAEQVIEHSVSGTVLGRQGNRGPGAAPQGLYPCAGIDRWLALAVADDAQWDALRAVLGGPGWADDPRLQTADGRREAHDLIDDELRAWTKDRDADELAGLLARAAVPAGVVIPAREVVDNPQLRHRGLFEPERHQLTGDHELPTLPFRFSRVPAWLRRPSPTLGEHNHELLTELGLSSDEIAALGAQGVIGDRPVGA